MPYRHGRHIREEFVIMPNAIGDSVLLLDGFMSLDRATVLESSWQRRFIMRSVLIGSKLAGWLAVHMDKDSIASDVL